MRALVLSGGGAKGAYQAGALKHLIGDLNIHYDILCGVSVGALNCGLLSMFSADQNVEALNKLVNVWETIETEKVHKRWFPFGRLHALWKKSLYNSQPLMDLIRAGLDLEKIRSNGRLVGVGAVSLSTGKYRTFSQQDNSFIDAVIASSAFPAFLTPITIDGELYTDGGVKEVTPLKQAIDFGATAIDVVMCSPLHPSEALENNNNTIDVAMRAIDLMGDEVIANDIKIALMYNQLVSLGSAGDKRFVDIKIISPDQPLNIESLTFDHNKIINLMNQGYADTKIKFKI